MNKEQKNYLVSKIGIAANDAITAFSKDKPVAHTTEYLNEALKAAGFISRTQQDERYMSNYVTLPLTKEMLKNKQLIEDYTAKVKQEVNRTKDAVFLGDSSDALSILDKFYATLKELQ